MFTNNCGSLGPAFLIVFLDYNRISRFKFRQGTATMTAVLVIALLSAAPTFKKSGHSGSRFFFRTGTGVLIWRPDILSLG